MAQKVLKRWFPNEERQDQRDFDNAFEDLLAFWYLLTLRKHLYQLASNRFVFSGNFIQSSVTFHQCYMNSGF